MDNYIQQIERIDQELLLSINGSDSLFWDAVMMQITSTQVWIPVFVVLLWVIVRNNSPKGALLVVVAIIINIVICDQVASGICKPLFARFRPTQDPYIMYLVDIVEGYRGGRYGFISSHAANTFGTFVFLSLLFRKYSVSLTLFLWALLSSYSRMYLGVHYPGDILCGCLVGCLSGYIIYIIYRLLLKRMYKKEKRWISSLYTSSGYLNTDLNVLNISFIATYLLIPIIGMWLYYSH